VKKETTATLVECFINVISESSQIIAKMEQALAFLDQPAMHEYYKIQDSLHVTFIVRSSVLVTP